jgi:hypothetical protein
MIPVGPLASLLVAGLVAALRKRKAAPGRKGAQRQPSLVFASRPAHGAAALRVIAIGLVLILGLIALITANRVVAAIACLVLCTLAIPSVATGALVRLGLVRSTLWFGRITGDPVRAAESRPTAAWRGADALLRAPDETSAARIERYLDGCVEIGTSGAAALALVALARGDRERARRLHRALEGLDRSWGMAREIRKLANEFGALDAASRGHWRRLALSPREPTTRLGRLVTLLAVRLTQAGPAPVWRIWLGWAVAPHRRRTRPLVEAALSAEPPAPAAVVEPSLAAFAALLARPAGAVQRADLEAAARSLDALRAATAAAARIQRRALALGVAAPDVLEKVCCEAEDDLAHLFVDESLPAAWLPSGPTGDAVRERVRQERFERLEALIGDLGRRRAAAIDLPEADEWCAWGEVRAACEDLLADAQGPEDRDALVSLMNTPLTSFAVRLCNVRSRRILARHMFMFLRDLADPQRAPDAHGLASKNVDATREESMRGALPTEGTLVSAVRAVARRRALYSLGFLASFFFWCGVVQFIDTTSARGVLVAWLSVATSLAGAVAFARTSHGLVDAVMTPNGLVIHTARGHFLALPQDISSVTVRRRSIHLVLRRRPRWLPWRVHTVASTAVNAAAHGERLAAWCAALPASSPTRSAIEAEAPMR